MNTLTVEKCEVYGHWEVRFNFEGRLMGKDFDNEPTYEQVKYAVQNALHRHMNRKIPPNYRPTHIDAVTNMVEALYHKGYHFVSTWVHGHQVIRARFNRPNAKELRATLARQVKEYQLTFGGEV